MMGRGPAACGVVAAVTAGVFGLTVAACAPGRTEATADSKAMDAIARDIQDALARRPDVANAKVSYQNNIETAGAAAVNVTLKPGSDSAPVIDDAVRLVWQSRLHPLDTIRVGVVYPDNNPPGTIRYVYPDKEKADLDRRYGPHPVG
jgi:hypothetical protein